MKKIYIANDHAAVETKEFIISRLNNDYEIINLGTNDNSSCNYAIIAENLANHVVNENAIGIVLCGSGIGVSIACNKVNGARCALVYNNNVAKLSKQHNNANIIAFGAREFTKEHILEMVLSFLSCGFENGRHLERLEYISEIEKKQNNNK